MSALKIQKFDTEDFDRGPGREAAAGRLAVFKLASVLPRPSAMMEGTFLGFVTVASVSFCILTICIAIEDPNYFSRQLIASFEKRDLDPIETGSLAASSGEGGTAGVESLPVPVVVRTHEPTPQDYQIIMVFEDEAILSTQDELIRVKVGSTVPGLGRINEIQATDTGGSVVAENATLKSVLK